MNDRGRDADLDFDELMAEVRQEFCGGLPERLRGLRAALDALQETRDPGAIEDFYRIAHTLKGTAPSFGADALVAPAAALADRGLWWSKGNAVTAEEISAARADFDQLQEAVHRYIAQTAGES